MDVRRNTPNEVVVVFSSAEALVFSDMLRRGLERVGMSEDPAERRLIDDLAASFEPIVDEVFSDTYADALQAAREEVRNAP